MTASERQSRLCSKQMMQSVADQLVPHHMPPPKVFFAIHQRTRNSSPWRPRDSDSWKKLTELTFQSVQAGAAAAMLQAFWLALPECRDYAGCPASAICHGQDDMLLLKTNLS